MDTLFKPNPIAMDSVDRHEPSVKSLPQNYKQDERGKNKASIGHGDSMGIFKVAKVDGDCFM